MKPELKVFRGPLTQAFKTLMLSPIVSTAWDRIHQHFFLFFRDFEKLVSAVMKVPERRIIYIIQF
jgi:hypothetical protein